MGRKTMTMRDLFIEHRISGRFLSAGDVVDSGIIDSFTGIDPMDVADDVKIIQSEKPICSDAIGNIGLYETFYRQSKLEAWTYAGLCERGSCQNRHPAAARKVFIITPYRVNPLFYRKLAAALCKEALERGDFPVAPHLYFTQFLPDNGYGREYGITAGHELMKHCNAVEVCLVDGLITEGMRFDIDYAINNLALDPQYRKMTLNDAEEFVKRYLEEK